MTSMRTRLGVGLVVAGWLMASAWPAQAQESLTRAKAFYASAAYEDALAVLTTLRTEASASEATEVAAYRVFCLLALGRTDEAKTSIEGIVRRDPLYRPTEGQASPRIRALFDEVRTPLLPDIARVSYGSAKDAYDRKDMALAKSEFDRVIALVDELVAAGNTGISDLRTLASGFRDLAVIALTPPPAPPKEPEPVAEAAKPAADPAPATPDPARVYSPDDKEVIAPVVVSRAMPQWRPESAFEAQLENKGTIELLVDENGRVLQATIIDSINPRYDGVLLRAAANWTFAPAQKDGKAVKYRYRIGLQLNREP